MPGSWLRSLEAVTELKQDSFLYSIILLLYLSTCSSYHEDRAPSHILFAYKNATRSRADSFALEVVREPLADARTQRETLY